MQASMFLVDGLRPGTVRVWQQARASGGTIEGIEVNEPSGDYVQIHCADLDQIKAAHKVAADYVELHTGRYANARRQKEEQTELEALSQAAKLAYKLGMGVSAGHGLNYRNVKRLTQVPEIVEYNIGHSIIARAVLVGLERAVREMKQLIS